MVGSGSRHFFVTGYGLSALPMMQQGFELWKLSPFVCLFTSMRLKLRNVLTYAMIRAGLVAAR
jgi:hypothetical protein